MFSLGWIFCCVEKLQLGDLAEESSSDGCSSTQTTCKVIMANTE